MAAAVAAVALVVALAASYAARVLAEREAVNDAATLTNLLAETVIEPALDDALLQGDPEAVAALDAVVRKSVLPNGVVRVKLWRSDGLIVYADESRLVGQRFVLEDDELAILANPTTRAEVSDLGAAENEFERFQGRLLEVYRPVWTPNGQDLLFEVYADYEPVLARSNDLWRGMSGLVASSLLLLCVLLAPLARRVLRRLAYDQQTREQLLRRAVEASDEERRRIAASLHDGPVQDLVATSYAVSGAAESADASGQPALAAAIRRLAGTVRDSIAGLRTLLVDIYPASLATAGLPSALDDLANGLRGRGVHVSLDLDDAVLARLGDDEQRLVYRVVQECVRNVVKHAEAATVRIAVVGAGESGAVVTVTDDGVGFVADAVLSEPEHGHLGLRVLTDLAAAAGAELAVRSAPSAGTSWRLVIGGS